MELSQSNLREKAIYLTKSTGILPAIKLKEKDNIIPYVHAMVDGGARIIEITMTTPMAMEHFSAIKAEFKGEVLAAAGTVLDSATARAAILAGASLIVSPSVRSEVIYTANRYGIACYSGAFTASECLIAMEAGAAMVKIFPAALGGPKYMTNLKMVFPEINLIPSGGIDLDSAGEYIRYGACAVSGSRNFFDIQKVKEFGLKWVTEQISAYIEIVSRAKQNAYSII